ncbi:hypothetical protein C8R43DRAFT_1135851 [Mycena crocata]|nr:hypothetical protein C8R43DRAFT_1135851 [Mycena crocata]
MSNPAIDHQLDADTGELLSLLDRLNIHDHDDNHPVRTTPCTPLASHTPSTPPANRPFPNRTFPSVRIRNISSPPLRPDPLQFNVQPTIYQFDSPSTSGYTTNWSTAGAATQGVTGATVRTVQAASPSKKKHTKKAAYVVYCGLRCGVFLTWAETKPLVSRVPSCIFRGYRSVREAEAAFEYAQERCWVRECGAPVTMGIPVLPQPNLSDTDTNPLNGDEALDSLWYIVYRGIFPGVYRSHLECQLNTVGIPGALHESVVGKTLALHKYTQATQTPREVAVVAPAYHDCNSDPFL